MNQAKWFVLTQLYQNEPGRANNYRFEGEFTLLL